MASLVHAEDEWSPLKTVLVGRAGKACFPWADSAMIQATMPAVHQHRFLPQTLFPPDLIAKAEAELDHLATLLEKEGIHVHRPPRDIDWLAAGGYTGAMPRDGLMVVGSTIIEACFAWPCRDREISLAFEPILRVLGQDSGVRIVRRPANAWAHMLMDKENRQGEFPISSWVINNSRPAFDTADFMRFGKVILGQYSHVTNDAGVNYIRRHLPRGYKLEMLDIVDPHAMHIDATILPLRQGLLVFNPQKVTPAALRRHDILAEWRLEPYPFLPNEASDGPPLYMTSPWLALNVLVLDGKRVVVEESDDRTAKWYEELGMECIRCPFRHVYSIGGSFHCTTVDLLRTPWVAIAQVNTGIDFIIELFYQAPGAILLDPLCRHVEFSSSPAFMTHTSNF